MARPRTRSRRLAGLSLAVVLPLLLGACNLPSFWAYTGVASKEHQSFLLYVWTIFASIVVGGITGGLILWCMLRYRRRKGDDAMPKQFQYHLPIEWSYTIVPIVIVLILFGFTVAVENGVDATPAKPGTKILATAFQWGWQFQYCSNGQDPAAHTATNVPTPCGGDTKAEITVVGHTTDNPDLVMPVGETSQITLVSNDVTHGFYVPELDFSRYALPGVTNIFDFDVTKSGDYRAQCTQLCGLYHSIMFFHVTAISTASFNQWLRSNAGQTFSGCPDATDAAAEPAPASQMAGLVSCSDTGPGTPLPTDPSLVRGVNPRT